MLPRMSGRAYPSRWIRVVGESLSWHDVEWTHKKNGTKVGKEGPSSPQTKPNTHASCSVHRSPLTARQRNCAVNGL